MDWGWEQFGDYVSAARKRRRAAALVVKLEKKGRKLAPVKLTGRSIATTFWGKAWCQNLESYGTYASRLPRGRSYVRNGAVVDLQIELGGVKALVGGTDLYEIRIKIEPLGSAAWRKLKGECAGKVGSLLDLLRGKLSGTVMEVITRKDGGLFPKPKEIKLDCSCPDHADMCKHLAAVLYGVGSKLDHSPELLFTLRGVDQLELFSESAQSLGTNLTAAGEAPTLDGSDLADVFGIELEPVAPLNKPKAPATRPRLTPAAPVVPKKSAKPGGRPTATDQSGGKRGRRAAKIAKSGLSSPTRKNPAAKKKLSTKTAKARRTPKAVVPKPPRRSPRD
jgi:uncharacterized Zn finger protein